MSEVTEEGFEFKEDWWGGDGVVDSWAGVGGVSILVGSWDEILIPSAIDVSMTELWVRDGVAIFWERFGCVPISARSEARGYFPSDEVSLACMPISSLLQMFRLFRAHKASFGSRPFQG